MSEIPTLQLNGNLFSPGDPADLTRGVTHPWENPQFPSIENAKTIATRKNQSVSDIIESRLMDNVVKHPKARNTKFWPAKLFDHLFQVKDVEYLVDELPRKTSSTNDEHSTSRLTHVICGRGDNRLDYRRLLALLLLIEKPELILKCISLQLADNQLPLDSNSSLLGKLELGAKKVDMFCMYQGLLSVPLLKAPEGSQLGNIQVYHMDLAEEHVQPWDFLDKDPQRTAAEDYALPDWGAQSHQMLSTSGMSDLGGGYGEVHRILIHPWQHDFQDILQQWSSNKNTFALKKLFTSDRVKFKNERDQLTRFGGQHRHIVTLLATISCTKNNHTEFYLLFPWAESDLLNYWKKNQTPPRSHSMLSWIMQQCYGIVDAVAFIHNPGVLNPQGDPVFGRHGDIKPENILWFKNRLDSGGMGALVLSDLGLAAIHRDKSRSNIPGHDIPATPNYRPPECNMDGEKGFISRSFDIWTLGCLFLELLVWLLNGWQGRQDFREDRCKSTHLHRETDIYFDIMKTLGEENTIEYCFKVKDQVTECIFKLHRHPDCTKFIHDFLDLIQTEMLIVQSDAPPVKRIKADTLRVRLRALRDQCSLSSSYCMDRCPYQEGQVSGSDPYPPVKARLNKVAIEELSGVESIPFHTGRSRLMGFHQKGDSD